MAPERPGPRNPDRPARGPERETAPGREDEEYESVGDPSAAPDPDVLLDVPVLGVEELHLEVENLKARISVQAELADMVKLNVGVDVDLGKVKLDLKGLDAQVLLKVRLDNIRAVLGQALEAIDRDPSILDRLTAETNRKDREPGDDGRPRDGAGSVGEAEQTVRRTVDEKGNAPRTVLDGSGDVVEESASGGLAGTNEAGRRGATDAAERKAREMGVDLSGVDGTGSAGRILVRDVKKAAKNGG